METNDKELISCKGRRSRFEHLNDVIKATSCHWNSITQLGDAKQENKEKLSTVSIGDLETGKKKTTMFEAKQKTMWVPRIVQLCDKKAEMCLMEAELKQEKFKHEDTYKKLKNEAAIVSNNEEEFKKLMIRHNGTIETNLEKRNQARKEILAEEKMKDVKDIQLKRKQEQTEQLVQEQKAIAEEIEKYRIYHDYVLEVWRVSDGEFESFSELIHRYNRFRATHEDLCEREEINAHEINKIRTEMSNSYEKRNLEIIELTNKISSAEKQIDDYTRQSREYNSKLSELQTISSENNLILGQINMAIDNLFHIVNKHINTRRGKETTLEKLDKIQAFIFDLQEVVQDVPRMISDSKELQTFFKEQQWQRKMQAAEAAESTTDLNIAQTPHCESPWDTVKVVSGCTWKLQKALERSQKRLGGNNHTSVNNKWAPKKNSYASQLASLNLKQETLIKS